MSLMISVRRGEELPCESLKKYLAEHVEGFPQEELEVRQFSAGRSNLTYLLRAGRWEAVLRRPPFGPLPPKAHDVSRECRILEKLYPVYPKVPKPYALCENPDVIGAPFYVMERVKGVTLERGMQPEIVLSDDDKLRISHMMADTLAGLHQVDVERAELHTIGRAEGFVERQLTNWMARYEKYKTEEIPETEKLIRWLTSERPEPKETTLIHNDFKLNNVILSEDLSQVRAVLDWEMATIGDPLFDLGTTLCYWLQPDDPDIIQNYLTSFTNQSGFLSRKQFLELYSNKTGRDVADFAFYLTFAYFRTAVAVQQIYYRYRQSQTKDERFQRYNVNVRNIMKFAVMVADGSVD